MFDKHQPRRGKLDTTGFAFSKSAQTAKVRERRCPACNGPDFEPGVNHPAFHDANEVCDGRKKRTPISPVSAKRRTWGQPEKNKAYALANQRDQTPEYKDGVPTGRMVVLCQYCLILFRRPRLATQNNHIVEQEASQALKADMNNLIPCCDSCNLLNAPEGGSKIISQLSCHLGRWFQVIGLPSVTNQRIGKRYVREVAGLRIVTDWSPETPNAYIAEVEP